MESVDQTTDKSSMARRRFLQKLGLISAAAATGSYTLLEVPSKAHAQATAGATNAQRWGLLIDTAKCSSGCDACVRGCLRSRLQL